MSYLPLSVWKKSPQTYNGRNVVAILVRPQNASKITASENIYRGKHCGGLQEQSDLGPHCLSMRLQIFQWTKKNIPFVIMRFKG